MKVIFLFLILFSFQFNGFGQYNDTLYYKSGMVKPVFISQHDEKFLTYEYRGKRGKLVTNRIPIDQLKYFVIYNEYHELVYDSRYPNQKKEETEVEEVPEEKSEE